jgi:hypothetical protein
MQQTQGRQEALTLMVLLLVAPALAAMMAAVQEVARVVVG